MKKIEMLPSNKLDNATIHQNPMADGTFINCPVGKEHMKLQPFLPIYY